MKYCKPQTIMIDTILRLTPIMTDVVKQGISEGLFYTPYPKEAVAAYASSGILADAIGSINGIDVRMSVEILIMLSGIFMMVLGLLEKYRKLSEVGACAH